MHQEEINKEKRDCVWRWVGFVWGCVVVLSSGTLFAFNCYSDVLAARLALTSTALNVAVNMGFVGQYLLSFIAGMLSDRVGVRAAYAYGTAAMALGYGGLYAQARTRFSAAPALVALWYLLVGIGGSGYYITTMNTVPRNFAPRAPPRLWRARHLLRPLRRPLHRRLPAPLPRLAQPPGHGPRPLRLHRRRRHRRPPHPAPPPSWQVLSVIFLFFLILILLLLLLLSNQHCCRHYR